jgi:molybdate transport system ATP-binding protein
MSLSVAIRHRLGAFALDAAFESAGRLTALFGPSGCGKTSVVSIIAGLIHPLSARIAVDGEFLVETERGFWLPPHRRRVGYVFQDARLFPHLNVRQNLSYGRWFTPKSRHYADEAAVIDMLGIEDLLARRPHQLSGGEKQRVALGRALLQSPRLLLMDEPLASLDEARKQEVMPYIERLRDETRIPIVYVSHSVEEVARLASDVVVMAAGRVMRAGSAQSILPMLGALDAGQAGEAGALLDMTVVSHDVGDDLTLLRCGAGEARVPGRIAEPGTVVRLHIKTRDVMIATVRPVGLSALNVFPGTIASIVPSGGASVDVTLDCGGALIGARITRHSARGLDLRPGLAAYAVVKTMSVEAPSRAPARVLQHTAAAGG